MELHKLFGDAIEISLPNEYIKLSEITNCPSHEEVFSHPEKESSINVEILEPLDSHSDQRTLECCWEDLLYANEAYAARVIEHRTLATESLPQLSDQHISAGLILGEQVIFKFSLF